MEVIKEVSAPGCDWKLLVAMHCRPTACCPPIAHSTLENVVMRPLDEFLAEYVTPALVGAGFQRSRRKYRLEADDGGMILVEFRDYPMGDAVSFNADWRPFPPVLRDYLKFRAEQASLSSTWMDQGGLFNGEVTVPVELRMGPYMLGLWWAETAAQVPALGTGMRRVLGAELVPLWREMLADRKVMAAVAAERSYGSTLLASVWLFIDDGDPVELRRVLDDLESQAPGRVNEVAWLRARLDARLAVDQAAEADRG